MFQNNSHNYQPTRKSFWKKPEGVGAAILLILTAAAAVGVVMFLPAVLTWLAGALFNLAAIIVIGSILLILGVLLSDKKIRTAIKYIVKNRLKKVGAILVQTNPIAILEGYVDNLKGKLREMNQGKLKLDKQIASLNVKIRSREEEMNNLYGRARQARNSGMEQKATTDAGRARDIEKLLETYKPLQERMVFLKTVLEKMESYAQIMIERISSKVELKKEEYNMTKTSHGVIKSAHAIIRGGTTEKQLFDQAWEYMAEQTEFRVMEMESMLHGMQDFMDNIDLDNATNMEEGMKSLEAWENKMNSSFAEDFEFLNAADNPRKLDEMLHKDESPREKQKVKVKVAAGEKSSGSKYFN